MPLKKRKSSENCWQQKSSNHFRSCLACDVKDNLELREQASALYSPTRRVRFMTDLPGRESVSDCGDSRRSSSRDFFKAAIAVGEKLERRRKTRSCKRLEIRKALETSKVDKKKLIQNLEQILQNNSALESKLSLVQDEPGGSRM
uniref:Uncharacterized protein n=1 Tax=Micrurus corallinus TaxID=54390 RepID=A0A2D4FQP3_MICCO